MNPAPVKDCRALDIDFGVDLAVRAITKGQAMAEALELSNIELQLY